jgi:hypothetical protein
VDYFGALTGFPSSCICVVSVNFSAPAPYVTSTYDAAQPVAGFGALALTDLPPAGTVNSMLLHLLSVLYLLLLCKMLLVENLLATQKKLMLQRCYMALMFLCL